MEVNYEIEFNCNRCGNKIISSIYLNLILCEECGKEYKEVEEKTNKLWKEFWKK